ncbi:hypothetical protein [Umboniibacter marinipuniceus]|uniref:Kazal-type serine protease inhibitor-like protein n=1 Tax=Umboniibacter marinipuniceus TaxID=569599 RepID=A0A3M0A784_9GAMM|nr:hypothetical protein [Umboniibacter marinipuniceus]RMA79399.1 Kazal-type serine protease inhibitor-like protein [Umboniibacter marinipuniceus]
MPFRVVFGTFLLLLSLSACAPFTLPGDESEEAEASQPIKVECPHFPADGALTICTMEYMPVCGQDTQGEWRTYANACDACASGATHHLANSCEMHANSEESNGK